MCIRDSPCTVETIGKTEAMAITKWLPKSDYKPLNACLLYTSHIRQIVPSVPVRSDAREHTDDRSPFLKYRTGDDWHIMQLNKTIWVNLPKGRGTKLQGLF